MPENKIASSVQVIPVDRIDVLNTRDRNGNVFGEIVENIKSVGLKKPISVTPRIAPDGSERYLLVCGEGRLKAFRALGESSIPAMVIDVSDEDAYIMSLAENIARRHYRPMELLAGIRHLRDQGNDRKTIVKKTGLSPEYVSGILTLLQHGEEQLLVAVQQGRLPIHAALTIVGAGEDDQAIQSALQDAYESGKLRGKSLFQARRVIERMQTAGQTGARKSRKRNGEVSASSLVRSYQKEVERQQTIVKRAEDAQRRILFVIEALRHLLAVDGFTQILRKERLDTLPKYLAERVWPTGNKA
ncbi:MAG: chromosome partitioning protein ParB [Rhodoferax ferrireducens]|uniref:Chromosome partitioning protein ParB n=2 Tax=Pseudomonadota TaxID=1224 RepID=A0A1Y1R0U1_9GAMM|nr:MAG: chromosome partitioning protein ParB [Rhodoferax ferrireducens]OQX17435.1 MAG: chromosome partitioning protein ParB [Thiothrix lacustris]